MNYASVDLHKHTITVAIVDRERKLLARRRFSNADPASLLRFLQARQPFELTVEATAGYEWFVRLIEASAARVVLAHPSKLRIIAQSTRKSDNLDATVLAEMLALDQIPAAYRPTPRQREHRLYVRQRAYLQRRITGTRNKIRRLLADHNLDRPDLFTQLGRRYLATLELPTADRFCLEQLLKQWQELRLQLHEVTAQLALFAASGAAFEQEDRTLLRSIPGVGVVTSEVILAELADWRRFSALKQLTAYAGLAPGQRESAGKRRALHIEKTGSPLLRWVLVQAAWQLVKRSPRWRVIYETLKVRLGTKKAVIAIARRLLGVCGAVLKSRQPYEERALNA
jgi:transposase